MKTETILFDTIQPWPGPVALADLLTEIESVIKKHVILSDHAAAALAVWVLHTYTFELRDTVAYVAIESPEKRCGKTTLLSVLAAMAHRPLISSNITVGALFRAIHNCSPTLFIDEADTFLAGNSIMRGIINSGNTRRTAYVLRLSASKKTAARSPSPNPTLDSHQAHEPGITLRRFKQSDGDSPSPGGEGRGEGELSPAEVRGSDQPVTSNFQPATNDTGIKKFSCWCPKVISMIGEAPDTIADRSIIVKMSRKLTTETCAPLAALDTVEIRSKCARFALDAQDSIRQHPKISGQGLNDRAADTFDPLYVIARHAGPEWETKLHTAALSLSSTAETENSGTALLLDILGAFADTASERMFSRDLVVRLREGATASQTLKYSSINEYQISKTLRQYRIRPVNIRIGKEVHRGYLASDFRDALKRYVSAADIDARLGEIQQRWELQVEANAQAQKEAELKQQFMATMHKNKKLTPEAWEILGQLNTVNQMPDKASAPSDKC